MERKTSITAREWNTIADEVKAERVIATIVWEENDILTLICNREQDGPLTFDYVNDEGSEYGGLQLEATDIIVLEWLTASTPSDAQQIAATLNTRQKSALLSAERIRHNKYAHGLVPLDHLPESLTTLGLIAKAEGAYGNLTELGETVAKILDGERT